MRFPSSLRLLLAPLLVIAALAPCASQTTHVAAPTTISIGSDVLHTGVQRFGINLSGQTFYDSGQLLRNLTFRNPGFEGGTWQSILHCKSVTTTSCTDENQYTVWPAGFLNGAAYEVLSGPSSGATGIVLGSSAAKPPAGITVTFATLHLAPGDFLRVRIDKPGNAGAGWWLTPSNGAAITTELKDLSPHSPGKQALRIEASGANQSAIVASFFDTLEGHSFVHLHGFYRLQFRARPLSANRKINIRVERLDTAHGLTTFFNRTVMLTPGWQDYNLAFLANDAPNALGGVALTFTVRETSVLLDDVALTPATRPANNPTAFRDEVVQTLRDLHPGVLRYMDNGTSSGSSLDNMLAPPFARQRAGASTQQTTQDDVPLGLHEFLTLCEAIGAEPWYSMPPALNAAEAVHLIEYLAGSAHTPYGAKRAALGHPAPWTSVFHTIHLEPGNEQWNSGSFAGSTLNDPTAYARRASSLFAVMRHTAAFDAPRFDLILGSWSAVPWWTQQEAASAHNADSIAIAPYLLAEFNDASSTEAIFGPMLAQPEQLSSGPNSLLAQQLAATQHGSHPMHLAVYETNLGTMSGSASQAALDSTVPSLGAGLAVADHMLLMLRDLGITNQSLFALPEFRNNFSSTSGAKETMPLWGAVVDMGGATNRRRPQFLALQLLNRALLPTMLATHITGANPTWDQPLSTNDKVQLRGAHLLQTFAFSDGQRHSLILLNLSRTTALPVIFAGAHAPTGVIHQYILTAPHITDTNEQQENVAIVSTTLPHLNPGTPYTLPPYSMTVLTWTTAPR